MDSNQPLDLPVPEPEIVNPLDNLAERWQRFVNMLIDIIGYYLLIIICAIFLNLFFDLNPDNISKPMSYLIGYLGMFTYYSIFEGIFGKTLGKLITRTRVVTETGSLPTFTNILGRSLCRIIPFDAFSFLGEKPVGWHDSMAHTMVIKDGKRIKNI